MTGLRSPSSDKTSSSSEGQPDRRDGTWLGWGHTMPNGDPAEPHAPDVQFDGCILLPPVSEPGAFHTPGIDEDKEIAFFAVASLYKEEMDLKLQAGTDKLLERMAKKRFGFL